jgi:hypothetical protein
MRTYKELVYNQNFMQGLRIVRTYIERVYMIIYVGPISSCILILKILLVYVYKFKDVLENL